MKTRKMVIAVLTATLLISAALIAGCTNPPDGLSFKPGTEDNFQIPEGKGVVRLKISDSDARTILPTPLATMYYDVIFTHATTSANNKTIPADISADNKVAFGAVSGIPIALATGNYSVVITAYNNLAGTIPIAGWTGNVSITATQTTGQTANLIAFVDGTGSGTFSYSITVPAGTTNTFDIVKSGGGTTSPTLIAGTNAASIPLTSGYYTVKVTSSQTDYLTQQYVRVLHIYPAMTSTMPTISITALVKNRFQVTFEPDDGTVEDTSTNDYSAVTDIKYGSKLTDPGDPIPDLSGYSFGGWYKNSSYTGGAWDFDTDRVLADYDLFAEWIAPGATGNVNFTVTFTFNDVANASASGGGTINRGNFVSGSTVTLTLAAPTTGSWSGITWYISGMDATDVADHVNGSNALVINNSSDFWDVLAASSFEVTVVATLGGSTTPGFNNGLYSSTVEITVGD
ncbi:MAG: InlB B-repeat-containing protein [Treponema sp.]|jgi:hypothetical protein|nr:InlB B-repeat-containing protein [Treponema sp.]